MSDLTSNEPQAPERLQGELYVTGPEGGPHTLVYVDAWGQPQASLGLDTYSEPTLATDATTPADVGTTLAPAPGYSGSQVAGVQGEQPTTPAEPAQPIEDVEPADGTEPVPHPPVG